MAGLRGAEANRDAGAISETQRSEIASIVRDAEIRDFEPLVYLIPYGRVSRLVKEVPVEERAHPLSEEYAIESLPRRLFDIIELAS
jgi:hypothetical protein